MRGSLPTALSDIYSVSPPSVIPFTFRSRPPSPRAPSQRFLPNVSATSAAPPTLQYREGDYNETGWMDGWAYKGDPSRRPGPVKLFPVLSPLSMRFLTFSSRQQSKSDL